MKRIILTCQAFDYSIGACGKRVRERYEIEIDEQTGDAQIVNVDAPRIERDRSATFGAGSSIVTLEVEAA